MLQGFLIFLLFILVCGLLTWVSKRLTGNMIDDYKFMQSQAEPRDRNQKLSDKMYTSLGGNSTVKNMVNISMLNHKEDGDNNENE